ncbi:hypothetical protein SERLADRAFT_408734 [Serpula lacrymans var. lacrymans S7.9]|uniref:Uncharacterized protein n=1 Tax=Serpula lacrymans var. lacrymans (strain S7.9) TaxID=578457 RepID=F8NW80_SERL9|nr:uncharacterized protein SERLADRAFT_408734 [Serpula lacrymans var. lacrymans S7.9]EGO24960.1 hypothetical protein SERLADRAFT_408734 [Serpula lacrymans var. lacrymans S7.9]
MANERILTFHHVEGSTTGNLSFNPQEKLVNVRNQVYSAAQAHLTEQWGKDKSGSRHLHGNPQSVIIVTDYVVFNVDKSKDDKKISELFQHGGNMIALVPAPCSHGDAFPADKVAQTPFVLKSPLHKKMDNLKNQRPPNPQAADNSQIQRILEMFEAQKKEFEEYKKASVSEKKEHKATVTELSNTLQWKDNILKAQQEQRDEEVKQFDVKLERALKAERERMDNAIVKLERALKAERERSDVKSEWMDDVLKKEQQERVFERQQVQEMLHGKVDNEILAALSNKFEWHDDAIQDLEQWAVGKVWPQM